jgi:hypothetical protein
MPVKEIVNLIFLQREFTGLLYRRQSPPQTPQISGQIDIRLFRQFA